MLDTGSHPNRAGFFDEVRRKLPTDPPVLTSRSWDALSDSLWEGLRLANGTKVIIVWRGSQLFQQNSLEDYQTAVEVLADVAESLADAKATLGHPKDLRVFIT
jgi:hypothetical protein